MEVVLASLIQNAIGQAPTKEGIIAIIESLGATAPEDEIDTFISKLKGRDLNTVIDEGLNKMAAYQQAAAPVTAAVEQAPVEEKVEEPPKPSIDDIDLFDSLF